MFATFRGPRLANLELKNATVKAIDGPTGSFVGMVDTVSEFVNLKSDATMIYAPTVKSSSWQGVGGIVGKTSNNTGVTFDGCVFTGDISSTNAYTNSAGGIVSITIGKVTVKNSIVTADITTSTTASGHSADWSGYGGIIGLTREGSLNSITIDSCYVSSTIKGYYRVGGIVGNLYATYNVNDGTGIKCDASIKNTQFDGVVMVGSNTEEGGGLIATKRFATSGTGVDLALENVVNTGKITDASGNARTFVKSGCTTNDHAHIWVARDWTGTTIKDCYDTQAHLIAHMGTEILATIIPATLGLNTWTVRDSYPVLTVAKDVASKKYVDVDLSWFEPNNTGTLANVKTQRQVGGLIRLIEACGCNNGTKFTTKYASMIKVSKAFEGVIADFTTDEYVKTTFANCVYASEEAVISHIYAQSSTLPSEGTNKYNIRFVAEIENLNHEQAGFDFYITYTDKTTGNTVYSNLNSVTGLTTAYSSIKAGGETRTPDGEGWFVVFTFTNLDVSIGNDIKITAVANVGDIVKGTNIDRYSKVGQWNVASDGTLSQAS